MNKRTRRKFTDEFTDSAIKLVTDQGYSVAEDAILLLAIFVQMNLKCQLN